MKPKIEVTIIFLYYLMFCEKYQFCEKKTF